MTRRISSCGSDLPAQDATEVRRWQDVAVYPPGRTPRAYEVREGHRRPRAAIAVDLDEHEPPTGDRDRHDGVAVVVLQLRRVAGGDVVGEDGDLLAQCSSRGPGGDVGHIAQRPDRGVPAV